MAALAAHASRLVLAGGRESRDGWLPPYRPNTVLAERLGLPITTFPGGHVGYMTHAEPFAQQLLEILTRRRLV
jgi:hypothetical protein